MKRGRMGRKRERIKRLLEAESPIKTISVGHAVEIARIVTEALYDYYTLDYKNESKRRVLLEAHEIIPERL